MPRILDVEAALVLLELEPPFDQREVQLARRRMAKRWHPDIAPPGRRHEHGVWGAAGHHALAVARHCDHYDRRRGNGERIQSEVIENAGADPPHHTMQIHFVSPGVAMMLLNVQRTIGSDSVRTEALCGKASGSAML